MKAPGIFSLAVKRLEHDADHLAQTLISRSKTQYYIRLHGVQGDRFTARLQHKVTLIFYDNLQRESHKTYAPPTSVT